MSSEKPLTTNGVCDDMCSVLLFLSTVHGNYRFSGVTWSKNIQQYKWDVCCWPRIAVQFALHCYGSPQKLLRTPMGNAELSIQDSLWLNVFGPSSSGMEIVSLWSPQSLEFSANRCFSKCKFIVIN